VRHDPLRVTHGITHHERQPRTIVRVHLPSETESAPSVR
jgi:hypothetical protein